MAPVVVASEPSVVVFWATMAWRCVLESPVGGDVVRNLDVELGRERMILVLILRRERESENRVF